jgi:ATP-dependent DNA helicase DinG
MSWRPHFPHERVRPEQERALDWIVEQFEAGERLVVTELGTGVGKSAIAVALAGWLSQFPIDEERLPGATVLTSQKILQDQYIRDFAHARDLRSSSNFQCNRVSASTCGETGRIRKAVGPKLKHTVACSECPFRQAKDQFAESRVGVTNYSYALSEAVYAGELPKRQLLVLDEAHNIEDEVRRWTTVEVSEADCREFKLDFPGPNREWDWLVGDYKACIVNKLSKLGGKLRGLVQTGLLSGEGVKKLAGDNDRLDKRLCQINRLGNDGAAILVSRHEDRSGKRSMRFQPLEIRSIAHEVLYSRADRVLLMSATLLDRGVFTRSIGVEGAPFISIPSPFPPKAFGMTLMPVGRMSQREIATSLPRIPRAIKKILAAHPNEKGIIHTTNYKIAEAIGDFVNGKRLLVQRSAADRERMLKQHTESSEPTVLVSPSMMEGLDLRDDLGRFQVVCKVPYPDMSDPIVKVKDRGWYNWRTARSLVQAVGRGVRSQTDWTKTYILDTCFMDLLERCPEMLPEHLVKNIDVEEA